jgi:hypothetical protein
MTSYNYSYNVLINRLEAFAAGHFLIKRFTHGQIDLADQLQDDQYPFMHVTPDTITPIQGGMQFGFLVMFADIPRDKEYKAEYQREVISDCIRLGQDLIAEVRNGLELFGFDVQLVNIPTFEPFIEEYKNTVTGIGFTLTLEVPWDWSACDIPAVWAVGGSSSGGSGTGYGLTLRTNGVDNAVQNILDLVEGTNVTITDNGDGSVTIDAAGGGGGELVSTEFNVNHTAATGNPYVIGDRVWYNGNVYRCIATNDALLPTNTLYWTLVGVGYRLRQTPVDWNATSGDYQILNKPTIPAAQVNSDWNAVSGVAEILNKPTIPAAQVNSDWNAVSGVAQILNKPTLATVATTGDYTDLINQPFIPTNLDDLADVNAPTPSNGQVLSYNSTTSDWEAVTPASGGSVTSVATAGLISGGPITTSGTITTAMSTGKLVGRYTAGSGIMEEITIGSGLTLTGAGVLNNTATPTPTGYYGAFQDDTTQTAVSANTAYPVKFNTTELSNGVTVVNDGSGNPTRVTIANTGIYNVQFSLQLEKTGGSGNFIIDIWLRKNGVDIPDTTGKVVLTGSANASPIVAAWNYLLDLAGGDYVQLMWSTTNNNAVIIAAVATPPHPGVPSSILTVTQQAGILAGTGITAINSLTGAVQTIGTGTTGTDFAVVSSGTSHTFNLPTASAANRGALSSADWSTFNGKQNAVAFTDVGTALATLPNPSAVRFLRINNDNTVTARTAAEMVSDLGIGGGSTSILYQFTNGDTVAAGATRYGALFGGSANHASVDASRRTPMITAGTISRFYVMTTQAQPVTGSLVLVVRKNSVDTALSVTIAAGSAAGVFTDLVNSVTVSVGDQMGTRITNNASNTSAPILNNQVLLTI